MIRGNYYISVIINGKKEETLCGKQKSDVLKKLDELNNQVILNNPSTINEIYYITLNGTRHNYKVISDGEKIISLQRSK